MTTTLPPPPPPQDDVITIDDLPFINLNSFTQSELLSLCKTSKTYFDPCRNDDVTIPAINRSVFNESAGSRRQTYSRLRLRHPHHRTARILRTSKPTEFSPSADPENHAIVHYLKHFLENGIDSSPPPPPPLINRAELVNEVNNVNDFGENVKELGFGGVKLGRRKNRENGVGVKLEKVNKNGNFVDFGVLESSGDGLYEEELKKRSVGVVSEEEVLGFLSGLEGQWCSRRKRRKYVDADELGDALPIGWKILLGIRRRDGTVCVYCRRFISPNGQQFLSCKEAALFLKSHFALNNARQLIDQRGFSMPQVYDITSTRTVGGSSLAAELMYEKIPVSILPVSDLHGTGSSFEEMDNLAEVQVHDLLKCFKCNLSFDEKDAYLQHVLTFHEQPPTKKIKFGRPVGEGVIIRDGKFECQFCHKVFEERRKYNGHVGVHVRNRETGDFDVLVAAIKCNESFTHEELVLHTATVNTSLELDGNTTLETVAGTVGSSCPTTMNTNQELALVTSQQPNMGSDNCKPSQPIEQLKVEGAPDLDLNQNDVEGSRAKTEMMNIDIGKDKPNDDCALPMPNDITYLSGEQRAGFSLYEAKSNNISGLIAQADIAHNEIASSSEFFMQSLECFPEFDSGSNKGERGFFNDDTKLQNVTGFEELGLDDLEPFDMANGSEMAEEPSSMIVFNSEEMSLNMDDGHPLTTLCVWCRSEFRLEHIDSEAQSDTIGYMCPTCKDKISGLS